MTPQQEKKLNDIHLAVVGDGDLGVPGLVHDVCDLKDWRRRLDLRVAGIAGGVSVVAIIVKHFFS